MWFIAVITVTAGNYGDCASRFDRDFGDSAFSSDRRRPALALVRACLARSGGQAWPRQSRGMPRRRAAGAPPRGSRPSPGSRPTLPPIPPAPHGPKTANPLTNILPAYVHPNSVAGGPDRMLVPGLAEDSYQPEAAHGKRLLNPSIAKVSASDDRYQAGAASLRKYYTDITMGSQRSQKKK